MCYYFNSHLHRFTLRSLHWPCEASFCFYKYQLMCGFIFWSPGDSLEQTASVSSNRNMFIGIQIYNNPPLLPLSASASLFFICRGKCLDRSRPSHCGLSQITPASSSYLNCKGLTQKPERVKREIRSSWDMMETTGSRAPLCDDVWQVCFHVETITRSR